LERQQSLERAIFELEKNKAINVNQIENLQREMGQSEGEIKSKSAEVASLETQLKSTESDQSAKVAIVEKLEQEEAQRRADIQDTEHKIEEARKKISDVNRQLDAKRNEYKLTKSMVENLEGFPESIKFLSKSKEWIQDVPLLSDLIYCKKDYRVAIENYLEPYLNYYVVQNLKDAYKAIQLLGKAQKGKANFFILDAFKSYQPPMVMLPNTQRAVELIETDRRYLSGSG